MCLPTNIGVLGLFPVLSLTIAVLAIEWKCYTCTCDNMLCLLWVAKILLCVVELANEWMNGILPSVVTLVMNSRTKLKPCFGLCGHNHIMFQFPLKMGHVILVAIKGTTILVPYFFVEVTPSQLKMGTCIFNLQVPALLMSCRDLITWQDSSPSKWLPGNMPHCSVITQCFPDSIWQ